MQADLVTSNLNCNQHKTITLCVLRMMKVQVNLFFEMAHLCHATYDWEKKTLFYNFKHRHEGCRMIQYRVWTTT